MLRIGICDDEKSVVEELGGITKNALERKSIPHTISLYNNGQAMLDNPQHLDIAFLDIDMPELDGFKIAQELRARSLRTKIIFVTGLTDKRESAFGVHAFGYIVKPFDPDEIERQLLDAYQYMESQGKRPELRFTTVNGGTAIMDEDDVLYFETVNRHTRLVTRSGEYLLAISLKKLIKNLDKFYFAFPHNSYCVNMLHVRSVKGYQLFMDNGDELSIAQRKSTEFRSKLNDFLQSTYYLK